MHIGVIGCGAMGSAFARYFAPSHQLYLFNRNPKKAEALAKEIGATACSTFKEAIDGKEVILLAIKPKDLMDFGSIAGSLFSKEQLVISVLGGTSLDLLRKALPTSLILRIMPNLALTCGKGMIGLCLDERLDEKAKQKAESLLQGMGFLTWLPESKMEGFTSLTSSGLAFVYVIIEAMVQSGVSMGLTAKESEQLATQMIEGAIALIKTSGKDPAVLKWEVASPSGTTIAGLNALEDKGMRCALIHAFQATYLRGKNLFT